MSKMLFWFQLSLFLCLCLCNEPDDLQGQAYSGTFVNSRSSRLFNYLDVDSGTGDTYFYSDMKSRQAGNTSIIAL